MAVFWRVVAIATALFLAGGLGACGSSDGDGASGSGSTSEGGDGDGDGDGDGSGGSDSGDGDGDGDGDGSGGSSSGGSGGSGTTASSEDDTDPVNDDLTLVFNPMYSAYDGVNDYKIPAIVQGLRDVRWSANPAGLVDLAPDNSTGGVLITTRGAGEVTIIARAGRLSGSAVLKITEGTPELWDVGYSRYNNEIPFPDYDFPDGGIRALDGGYQGITIPDNLSCRNCHSSTAEALDVEHTPQQTGGYSDEELISIFSMGIKPEGATFHTPFPESIYTRFHTWEATDEEKRGLVLYLRSLEPKTQGPLDFGGLMDVFGGP